MTAVGWPGQDVLLLCPLDACWPVEARPGQENLEAAPYTAAARGLGHATK